MKVLEVRPEQCIIQDDAGVVCTRPTGEYYKMRLFTYNNGRIHYIFGRDMFVFETFDQRIFNATCWGLRCTMRQDLSDKIIAAIRYHMNTGSSEKFEELFSFATKEVPNWDVLDTYLHNLAKVEKTNLGFQVHGEFLIDYKGNAWTRREEEDDDKNHNMFADVDNRDVDKDMFKRWSSLCIVMQGHEYMAEDSYIPDGNGQITRVNSLTMTIITKVMFLVNPDMQDSGFVNQIPERLRIKLKDARGGETGE